MGQLINMWLNEFYVFQKIIQSRNTFYLPFYDRIKILRFGNLEMEK